MLYFPFQWVVTLAYDGANVTTSTEIGSKWGPLEGAYKHRVKFNKFSYNGVLLYFVFQ